MSNATSSLPAKGNGLVFCLAAAFIVCCVFGSARTATAQPPQQAARNLDRKADELRGGFLKQLEELAGEYEKAGLYDRAKDVYRQRQRIERSDDIAQKLDELDERDFETNQLDLKITPDRGWLDTGLDVKEDEPVRIEAAGSVRMIMNVEVDPAGLALPDDMPAAPLGSLIAVVYPPREGRQKPQPTEPVVVGAKSQFEPEKSGRLFLRVVAVAGAKNVGEYDVRLSGKIYPASGSRPSSTRPLRPRR